MDMGAASAVGVGKGTAAGNVAGIGTASAVGAGIGAGKVTGISTASAIGAHIGTTATKVAGIGAAAVAAGYRHPLIVLYLFPPQCLATVCESNGVESERWTTFVARAFQNFDFLLGLELQNDEQFVL